MAYETTAVQATNSDYWAALRQKWADEVTGKTSAKVLLIGYLAGLTATVLNWQDSTSQLIAVVLTGAFLATAFVAPPKGLWLEQKKRVLELEEELTHKLEMHFENKLPYVLEKWHKPDPGSAALFAQVLVLCNRRVTDCMGNVTQVSVEQDGDWKRAEASGFGPLDWDLLGRRPIHIDAGVERFLQIVQIPKATGIAELMSFTNYKYAISFERGKRYKIDFAIACNEQAHPLLGSLIFRLGQSWDQIEAEMISHDPQALRSPQGSIHGR